MHNHIFIFLAQKTHFLKLCIWSVRSLQKFSYFNILIIVDKQEEKDFLERYLTNVEIRVIKVDTGNLNMWCWKPLLLKNLNLNYEQIIVSDVDVIWHKNPTDLLNRVNSKFWSHKITALDPKEIIDNLENKKIPKRRLGLINMVRFFNDNGIKFLPNFQVNGGLFSVTKNDFKIISEDWYTAIKNMKYQFIMTEAILSIVLANRSIAPFCDEEDIKHHKKIFNGKVAYPIIKYKLLNKTIKPNLNGYRYATHYHGDQRLSMVSMARKYNLDKNNFIFSVIAYIILNKIKRIINKIL
tara:strand:- start:244 stop:1131 length:888 start_codon:yes stop_codon:yes gene_type:complete